MYTCQRNLSLASTTFGPASPRGGDRHILRAATPAATSPSAAARGVEATTRATSLLLLLLGIETASAATALLLLGIESTTGSSTALCLSSLGRIEAATALCLSSLG